jgi:hypothetical protein
MKGPAGTAAAFAEAVLTAASAAASPKETVLYRFAGGHDAANPLAGLLMDTSGAVYGTTAAAGSCGIGPVAARCSGWHRRRQAGARPSSTTSRSMAEASSPWGADRGPAR